MLVSHPSTNPIVPQAKATQDDQTDFDGRIIHQQLMVLLIGRAAFGGVGSSCLLLRCKSAFYFLSEPILMHSLNFSFIAFSSHILAAVRWRISSFKMIRRLRCIFASSSLGGTGGIHGIFVGTSVALITRSFTAALTAFKFQARTRTYEQNKTGENINYSCTIFLGADHFM